MNGLRQYLNRVLAESRPEEDFDEETVAAGEDDQTMTGMMGATALNADEEDADEELDDGDGTGGPT